MLAVVDNGHGLAGELDTHSVSLGVGIPGMRGRLRQLGGNLKIRSTTDGVTVRAVVPVGDLASGNDAAIAHGVAH